MPVKGGPHPSVSLDSGEKSLQKAGKPYMVGNIPMFCSVMGIGSDIPPVFLNLNRATVFLPALFMILPTYEGKQR